MLARQSCGRLEATTLSPPDHPTPIQSVCPHEQTHARAARQNLDPVVVGVQRERDICGAARRGPPMTTFAIGVRRNTTSSVGRRVPTTANTHSSWTRH